MCINPFPNKPLFLRVCIRSIQKTMLEKENLPVKSNFSFFHSVFNPYGEIYAIFIQPFPKRQVLDSSKLKQFADDNFEFDKNGSKFSKQVENTLGKGEIVCYEQFLLFPQCFQRTCTADM